MTMAYFIGGERDLTKMALPDHLPSFYYFAKPTLPIALAPGQRSFDSEVRITTLRYRLNWTYGRLGEEVGVYVYDGEDLP